MSLWENYYTPASVGEALSLLRNSESPSAIIAGGTDLLLDLEQGRRPSIRTLIDISQIEEMLEIRQDQDSIFLGAAVTHSRILDSPLLSEHARCLVEGCGLIGGPQVRNVATIGGNVAHALPAGDGTIALIALDALACIVNSDGEVWQPIGELFAGPGETTFNRSREILTGFRIPLRGERDSSAFNRIMRPQGVAIAILKMAVWVGLEAADRIGRIRIAAGPGGPRPFRAYQLEGYLEGRTLTQETLEAASEILLEEIQLRTSPYRATVDYRRHLIAVLLSRTLNLAVQRANGYVSKREVPAE